MKIGKLVKYEQRPKTNRIKFLEKMHENWNIPSNRKLFKSSNLFFECIYNELTKKTKLKTKPQNETRKLLTS